LFREKSFLVLVQAALAVGRNFSHITVKMALSS
jgi:hypothetical protein